MKEIFRFKNDVNNEIELNDEGGFVGIRLTGPNQYASMSMKKEFIKKMEEWLSDYLEPEVDKDAKLAGEKNYLITVQDLENKKSKNMLIEKKMINSMIFRKDGLGLIMEQIIDELEE